MQPVEYCDFESVEASRQERDGGSAGDSRAIRKMSLLNSQSSERLAEPELAANSVALTSHLDFGGGLPKEPPEKD